MTSFSPEPEIQLATIESLNIIAPMFNEYRQFYKQPNDEAGCREFLEQRLVNQQSVIFIAKLSLQAAGFVQLYPGYSSINLKPVWTLNDLYVRSFARRKGVGFALLDAAKQMAMDSGAVLIHLSTLQSNIAAQQVYESRGYRRDRSFYHYSLPLNPLSINK